MSRISQHDFSRSSKRYMPLSNEQIAARAPAIFAEAAHESRSSRYAYIPTVKVLDGMRNAGFLPVCAKQSRSRDESKRDFTKHMIRFRREGSENALQRVGDTFPEVVLVNAHDGTSSYQLMAGLFRLACLNGLIVGAGELDVLRIPHTGNIVDEVIEGSFRVLNSSVRALEAPEKWSKLALSNGERNALAEAAHVLRFGDAEGHVDTPITAQQLLYTRRPEDKADDLWSTFNVIQENVIRGGLSARAPRDERGRRGRMVSTREINGIGQDVKLNKALWVLAERLAQAKAV
jgi:hypothetical protein